MQEPQALRMRSKGTCQSAKSSTTGESYGRRVPMCVRGRGRPRGASGPEGYDERDGGGIAEGEPRIVAGPTALEETRSVVSGPSGGGHGK